MEMDKDETLPPEGIGWDAQPAWFRRFWIMKEEQFEEMDTFRSMLVTPA